ncbi:MAG: WD40 repeat domain-containing protein, partial [Gemmataceae bacterium]
MRRVWSFSLSFVALMAGLTAIHGADDKKPRTDLYGDPLPPGAMARMGTTRMRHVQAIFTFSPDGKELISFGPGGDVCFWDVAEGKLRRRQQLWRTKELVSDIGFRGWSSQQALSPDGARVARLDGDKILFYDTRTGKLRSRLTLGPADDKVSRHIDFSSNGKILIVCAWKEKGDSIVQWWDIESGKLRRTFKVPSS